MNKNSPVYLACFLAITAGIAGGALYAANAATAPVIAQNAEKAEKQSLLAMYPDASLDAFVKVDAQAITADHPMIETVYKYGESDVIFKCSVSGYDQGIVFLVYIDTANVTIDSFKAISNGNTKGIGSRIMDQEFADSIIGKDASGELDTISGATYTSTPVIEAIRECAVIATQID